MRTPVAMGSPRGKRESAASCGTAFPNVEAEYLSLFGNCKPDVGINCDLGSLKDTKEAVSEAKGGFLG